MLLTSVPSSFSASLINRPQPRGPKATIEIKVEANFVIPLCQIAALPPGRFFHPCPTSAKWARKVRWCTSIDNRCPSQRRRCGANTSVAERPFAAAKNTTNCSIHTFCLRESRMPWRRQKCRRFSKFVLTFVIPDVLPFSKPASLVIEILRYWITLNGHHQRWAKAQVPVLIKTKLRQIYKGLKTLISKWMMNHFLCRSPQRISNSSLPDTPPY